MGMKMKARTYKKESGEKEFSKDDLVFLDNIFHKVKEIGSTE